MSLPHFYLENQVIASEGTEAFPLRLSPDDAKHARALRLAPGEHVAVVDAAQDYFECEVVSFADAVPLVRVACRLDADGLRPSVMLVQGLAKGDKMETVVRHATELGVAAFVPLACERSVVKLDERKAAARTERWLAVARSAAMQSGQPAVPEVCPPVRLDEALGAALADLLMPPEDARVAVVVGPEGGLAPAEVEALLACNPRASLVTLGPTILRTETAGVVAPALVLHELRRMARGRCAL